MGREDTGDTGLEKSQTGRVEFPPRKDKNPKQQKEREKRRAQRLEAGEGSDRQEEH